MESVDLPDPPRHVVDTSGWLEHFADDQNADLFAKPIWETGTRYSSTSFASAGKTKRSTLLRTLGRESSLG